MGTDGSDTHKHSIVCREVESLCCTPETNACNEGEKRQQKEKKYDPWLPGMGMEDTQIIEDF